MRMILLLVILILTHGCDTQKGSLTNVDLILADLQEEHTDEPKQKNRILNSIIGLYKNDDNSIMTTQFQSALTGEFKAILYVLEDGVIKDRIERLNDKYHPGHFEVSSDLKHIRTEVKYKILLPSSSVPQVALLNEYFEITSEGQITSLFEFIPEERDCSMGREKGELIKRSVDFREGNYFLNKSVYEFDCEDFEFEEEIEGLILISTEEEKLTQT